MFARSLKMWASLWVCISLAACGGGGGGGGGTNPPQPPAAPQSQTIAFAQVGPLNVLLGSVTSNAASGGAGTGAISYASSNPAAVVIDAATGAATAVGLGTATITATKAASANHLQAQAAYTARVQTANTVGAWIGANDTQVFMPAVANGKQFVRARSSDCVNHPLVRDCSGIESSTIVGDAIVDTRGSLTTPAHYSIYDGANEGALVEVTAAQFSARIGHGVAYFRNRYWVIGGAEPIIPGAEPIQHRARADVWSSPDGKTWKLETNDGGFGARWFAQVVVFNNRLWIISGSPQPTINPAAPWYDDVWSSEDGITWQQRSNHAFPWRSTDLNVIVFNNEMLAISGGRVYSSTNGTFAPKVVGDPVLLTGTSQGRAFATLTMFNNELWYIGGKLDFPINVPPGGDAMNDVWKSANGTTWTQVTPTGAIFSPRYRHSTFVANSRLWVLGGTNATNGVPGPQTKDLWSTADGVTWTQEQNPHGLARGYLMQAVQEANKATLISGIQYAYSNEVWQTANGSTWTQASASAQFSSRHTRGVTFNDQMWIVGGQSVDGRLADSDTNEVWRSADGLNWTRAVPTGTIFSPRDGNGLVAFNNRLWVIGGWSHPNGPVAELLNDVWSSADGASWRQETAGAQFSPRVGAAALAYAGKLWMIGGYNGAAATNDVWSSVDGVTWTQVSPNAAFAERIASRVTEFGNAMWLIGGNSGTTLYNDIWRSTDGAIWTQVVPTGTIFEPRTRHGVAAHNSKLYVIGGTVSENYATGARFNDVWSSANGTTWQREMEHSPFSARSLHAVMVHQNQLWIVGGMSDKPENDVWRSSDGINWRVGFTHNIAAP